MLRELEKTEMGILHPSATLENGGLPGQRQEQSVTLKAMNTNIMCPGPKAKPQLSRLYLAERVSICVQIVTVPPEII